MALAEIEALGSDTTDVVVTKEHIAKVVEMSKDFKRYIRETHNASPSSMAASFGHRADRNDSPSRAAMGFGAARPF